MLPPPTLSFTIPSIHDDLVLQCRVYHPTCLNPTKVSQIEDWQKRAAIFAHPYAPLGGSYDDPIVDIVAGTILKQGFCVGTFNFRGAGSSKGRTSWQSKAEQNDYISFIGFMVYYMHHLSLPPITPPPIEQPKFIRSEPELHNLTPVPSQALPPPHMSEPRYLSPTSTRSSLSKEPLSKDDSRPRLLLGGYSYGAMVASCLPAILSSTLAPFQNPEIGSAHAEIRLRAESLAKEQNKAIHKQISKLLEIYNNRRCQSTNMDDLLSSPKSRRTSHGVRMGGEEDLRRASHDSHRSKSSFTVETQERVRKSVDRVRSFTKSSRFSPGRHNSHGSIALSYHGPNNTSDGSLDQMSHDGEEPKSKEPKSIIEIPGIADIKIAYLLVSPLRGFVHTLATMWSSKSISEREILPNSEMKFAIDPTLALFADDDIFVSIKRLRSWVEKLTKAGKGGKSSQFMYRVVEGAGHFWHDYEAVKVLQEEVKTFASRL